MPVPFRWTAATLKKREPAVSANVRGSATVLSVFLIGGGAAWAQMFDARVNGEPSLFNERFGHNVALDGAFLITGAPGPNEFTGSLPGAAFVHRRVAPGVWEQEARLTAPDPAPWDHYGWSVAIDGEVAIVGATKRDDCGKGVNCNIGAAYVFRRTAPGEWSLEQILFASDPAPGDEFGFSVAIEDNLAAISAPFDDDNGSTSGSVYIFRRDGAGVWSERAKLISSDGQAQDFFGQAVSIDQGTLVVGASGESSFGASSGAAYVFEDAGGDQWMEIDKLVANDAFAGDQFGFDVAIDGDAIVVGAPLSDASCGFFLCNGGAAYVFRRSLQGTWNQESRIFPQDTAFSDFFGFAVDISGDALIATSVREDDAGNSAGAMYTFQRAESGVWIEQLKLTAPDGEAGDELGFSGAIDGVLGVAGARFDDAACPSNPNCNSGSVYAWSLRQFGDAAPGDLNADGVVNGADLATLLSVWGTDGQAAGADLNDDGVVNGADLAALLANWGA